MKLRYLTTAMLAMGLMNGCICVKVSCDCKPKHHEGKESGEGDEEKEEGESKHHEGKESEDREDENEGQEGKEHKDHKESEEKEGKDSKAALQARAKLSEAQARAIAMAKVPNGTIKEGELEMENGKLQWSFDMATPGSRDITEVNIDAITGKIIAVDKESPAQQAKEKDDEKEEKEKDDK